MRRTSPGHVTAPGTAKSTIRSIAYVVAKQYVLVLAAFVLWALAPLAFQWQTVTVVSGSMQPQVNVGDLMVYSPVGSHVIAPPNVVVVLDPARPGALLTHRVVRVNPDGSLITRGDANAVADSTPVPPENVVGVARLRVPWIGLPLVWWRNENFTTLGPFLLLTLLAGHIVASGKPSQLRPRRVRGGAGQPDRDSTHLVSCVAPAGGETVLATAPAAVVPLQRGGHASDTAQVSDPPWASPDLQHDGR